MFDEYPRKERQLRPSSFLVPRKKRPTSSNETLLNLNAKAKSDNEYSAEASCPFELVVDFIGSRLSISLGSTFKVVETHKENITPADLVQSTPTDSIPSISPMKSADPNPSALEDSSSQAQRSVSQIQLSIKSVIYAIDCTYLIFLKFL
ncbi:hypothetical protein L3X38_011617 [Prunus dulcis]|uniref:Uncharacterized protein n=1 Tax=Prunus dulcis TaxID=3755 RepID=A0AAD4WK77_PRUDU|nr:hypothetical protein L3X38_011617 [Prunus dulcis]